jgi:hypothetical protein
VALVQNLQTGHVSRQYHVVFDDKFKIVFSDGETSEEVDKICNELFVNSRDCYVEEEYNKDGMLIYKPRHLLTKCGFLNLPTALAAPEEAVCNAPEEAEDKSPLGRSIDRKRRRIQKHYSCSLVMRSISAAGSKKSIDSAHISQKHGEYIGNA